MLRSILQYFRPSLSYHLSLRPLFILEWLLKTSFTVLAFGFACISMQEELSLMPIFKQKMSQNFPMNLSAEGVLTVTVKGFPAATTGKLMI